MAKTDRVDSKMLAVMADALKLPPSPVSQPNMFEFRELLTAKRALTKDRSAAKTRLTMARNQTLRAQLQNRLRQIDTDIAQIESVLLELANQQEAMIERLDILASIPGIGKSTALTILIDMPEIGTMTNKQVGSLAGLAPISQSSGQWQGKERIQGGRAALRKSIYMPALVAIRFNAD
ncbi:MAG: IS110 family transposase, partial [Symploca sp. SIO1A3]|nr:IS110 family transposase [Symploca sp. SIO1A3]